MSLRVHVSLLSGRDVTLEAAEGDSSETLAQRAQTALGVGKGRLRGPSGEVSPKRPRLQEGDALTLEVVQTRVTANSRAFAAILGDGAVQTYGDPDVGGDSRAVQDQLRSAHEIAANDMCFAAILDDGSVVTWGEPREGGDSSAVQEQLKNVTQIAKNRSAFAAIRADGSVVTWESPVRAAAGTAAKYRRGCRMCSTSQVRRAPSPPSGQMARWSPGETPMMAGTAAPSRSSFRTSRRLRQIVMPTRLSERMEQWSPGSLGHAVGTAAPSRTS